jgi:cell division protein FtsZ
MGTGVGKGDSRAMEAAQQSISSPLLDNVSVHGATGVLVNITGGSDLTLGEVNQVQEIIHEAVGDQAEVIFGAVIEPSMQGELRVTVIATGFDRPAQAAAPAKGSGVIQFPAPKVARVSGGVGAQQATGTTGTPGTPQPPLRRSAAGGGSSSVQPDAAGGGGSGPLSDMEIPTFIRRQMD